MESLLKKVNELEGQLIKAVKEADKSAEENAVLVKENSEVRATLNKKAKDLKAREEAIKPIEDIGAFKVKADQTMRDANKKMKSAMLQQDEADKRKAENLKEHAEQKARIAKADAKILDDKKGIKKGYEQLKTAKANAESELVTSFVKKIKKGS